MASTSFSAKGKLHNFCLEDLQWSFVAKDQFRGEHSQGGKESPSSSIDSTQPKQKLASSSAMVEDKKDPPVSFRKRPRKPLKKTTKEDTQPIKKGVRKPRKKPPTSKVQEEGQRLPTKKKTEKAPAKEEDKPEMKIKLSLTLTPKEIEEDFYALTGNKLPRNRIKRNKTVQNEINNLLPGKWFDGKNADDLQKEYWTEI